MQKCRHQRTLEGNKAVVMRLLVARGSLTQDPISKARAKRKWPPFADQQGEVRVSF